MEITTSTRERILSVSENVFYKKGLAGARMQEIADMAGINKAMLHYYFKTKEQLFNDVFERAFGEFVGRITQVLNSESSLKSKVNDYVDHTIDSLKHNPGITVFVIQELNANPQRITELFAGKGSIDFTIFKKQIEEEFKGKKDAEMFFTDMVAMCIYPFIARPIFEKLLEKNDSKYLDWMDERKKWIKEQLI